MSSVSERRLRRSTLVLTTAARCSGCCLCAGLRTGRALTETKGRISIILRRFLSAWQREIVLEPDGMLPFAMHLRSSTPSHLGCRKAAATARRRAANACFLLVLTIVAVATHLAPVSPARAATWIELPAQAGQAKVYVSV